MRGRRAVGRRGMKRAVRRRRRSSRRARGVGPLRIGSRM